VFAGGSLKKLYVDDMPVRDAVLACVQALYGADDDDSATGGPDLTRRIFSVIATITAQWPDHQRVELRREQGVDFAFQPELLASPGREGRSRRTLRSCL
jgi:20S proteasome alpha/beta subunit